MSGNMIKTKVRSCSYYYRFVLTAIGEYQPVYDEFGAILLLVLAFVHRYELTYHDIGARHDSFIAQLLSRGHISLPADELTDDQGRYLGKWLCALFGSEFGAEEGINDELMSSCRPQEFYLLVPTLFEQTVFACSAEVFALDAVKGGLECQYPYRFYPNIILTAARSPGNLSPTLFGRRLDLDDILRS